MAESECPDPSDGHSHAWGKAETYVYKPRGAIIERRCCDTTVVRGKEFHRCGYVCLRIDGREVPQGDRECWQDLADFCAQQRFERAYGPALLTKKIDPWAACVKYRRVVRRTTL